MGEREQTKPKQKADGNKDTFDLCLYNNLIGQTLVCCGALKEWNRNMKGPAEELWVAVSRQKATRRGRWKYVILTEDCHRKERENERKEGFEKAFRIA